MCDYSLENVASRAANKGEKLISTRFPNAMTKGFAGIGEPGVAVAVMAEVGLELSGHETHVAHDGDQAVESAERLRPDVVILDIGLPKLNGLEVARRIRAEPWGRRMTLVALTGWGQADVRRQSVEAGFDQHLVKPIDSAALDKLLAEADPAVV
jgi:CheY-like chemotaxis protein